MYSLPENLYDGCVVDPDSLQQVLTSITPSDESRAIFDALLGPKRLLECRGIAGITINGKPAVEVARVQAWINGRVIAGRTIRLKNITRGAHSIFLSFGETKTDLSQYPSCLTRQISHPVLFSQVHASEDDNVLELARLSWNAGSQAPEVHSLWWPDVLSIAGDDRSSDAFNRISDLLKHTNVPGFIKYELLDPTRTSWNKVLPWLLEWMEQRGHKNLFPDKILYNESGVAEAIIERLEQSQQFPPRMQQLENDIVFHSKLRPDYRSRGRDDERVVFQRKNISSTKCYLVAIVDSIGNSNSVLRVEPGDKTIRAIGLKPVLVSEWHEEIPEISISIGGGVFVDGAVYVDD